MTTKKSVSPEDAALFRRAVGPVRTVDDSRPAQSPAPTRKARPKPRDARLPAAADPSFSLVEAGERLSYASAGVPARVLRELRRGRYPVEDEVHLRGMRAAEALRAAGDFIRAARADGLRCVRIVHGKRRLSPRAAHFSNQGSALPPRNRPRRRRRRPDRVA